MTNSLCSWTMSFRGPGSRSRTLVAQGDGEATYTLELPWEALWIFSFFAILFMYVVLYTPHRHLDRWGSPPTTEQRLRCIVFLVLFCFVFLLRIGMLFFPCLAV